MTCPECNEKTRVVDTVATDTKVVIRRRKCTACGHLFYTKEIKYNDAAKLRSAYYEAKTGKPKRPVRKSGVKGYESQKLKLIKQFMNEEV